MDLKYIGSGEAAKALVYYITDYITKSQLPTHIGLSAVMYAIRQNTSKFESSDAPTSTVNHSLFTKTVNAMMARQEISHQQVMSYLIGGGDFYCSHSFKMLKWCIFDGYISHTFPADVNSDILSSVQDEPQLLFTENNTEPLPAQEGLFGASIDVDSDDSLDNNAGNDDDESDGEHEVINDLEMLFGQGNPSFSNTVLDYTLRPNCAPFNSMSLWECYAQSA
ncbi:hypothetical protein SERLA73DRAFT_78767 [Serpula lacrymans var. lacrymans S7.3]|uniref:Uncharacterized protein n=2 Tax=Serpula lacrymans var. lacrymans TaxID=341189 RepID=F8QE97_SERL3|nr:uncharacterized protein SERLADRAFT_443820 [Serpula lacrymans var. lacrymans S7.9]EGN93472.1 hypothetical protein SERLA73DRAFT_78767 [Serpula lacrymans var. lacrymans S7.3]EGO18850.1 hypothetical protein SERLADRAFT_443820 [Serpula lacrymans var. lacrymans S7.9]